LLKKTESCTPGIAVNLVSEIGAGTNANTNTKVYIDGAYIMLNRANIE
jgi:hypothetical protein